MSSHDLADDLIKDKNNPKSLVSMCPSNMAERIAAIPDNVFSMDDKEIEKAAHVTEADKQMRAAFFIEYERAVRNGDKISPANVYKGIVTASYFHNYVINNSFKLAFVIRPYREYQAQLEELLQFGFDRMSEIMRRSQVDENGKLDHKLAALQMQLWKELADRRRGSTTKNINLNSQIQSTNLNITKDITAPRSVDEIDKKLKELEAQEAKTITITHKEMSNDSQE